MKAAIYARVSTDRQESMNQIVEMRELCIRRGWEISSEHEYIDESISGRVGRKPRLEELLCAAHRKEFDIVAFWSLDRLTRLGPDDAADILARIEATGCDFLSLREQALNSLGPWKRVVVDILAIVANFEAQRISDRTKAGLARARAQGKRLGRPPRDFGTLTAADVARMRAAGLSWSKMETDTGIPAGSLRRLAKIVLAKTG